MWCRRRLGCRWSGGEFRVFFLGCVGVGWGMFRFGESLVEGGVVCCFFERSREFSF